MTNWVGNNLTITGPQAELGRFAACWIKAKGERFPRWVEGKFKSNQPRPEGELYFSFDRLTPPKPDDWDEWVLARWGMKYVAIEAKIESEDGAIKFSFQTADDVAWALYEELAELFPLLTMEGSYSEYGSCIAGDVRCHGGKFTHVDKSEEFAAETRAREAAIAKESDDEFYADLLKFVAGEPNGITPDTIGEERALIAEMLVAEDAGLVAPARRGELMDKIRLIYRTPHCTAAR